MPRLAHSKSRLGCKRCKQRKVKCDEVRPSCKACLRHNVICEYPKVFVKLRDQYSPASRETHQHADHVEIRPAWPKAEPVSASESDMLIEPRPLSPELLRLQVDSAILDKPSPEPVLTGDQGRRRFEAQLIHFWTLYTSRTFAPYGDTTWAVIAPELAASHEPLLDEILAFTALYLSRKGPYQGSGEYMEASHLYFQRALEAHAAQLEHLHAGNIEAAAITAILLSIHAFAIMNPSYLRGVDVTASLRLWFAFSSDKSTLIRQYLAWTDEHKRKAVIPSSVKLLQESSNFFLPTNCSPFAGLLRFELNSEQPSAEDLEAYDRTLGYVGAMHAVAAAAGSSPTMGSGSTSTQAGRFGGGRSGDACDLSLRLLALPSACPPRFAKLVNQRRPRAMVILAHAFAVALMVPDIVPSAPLSPYRSNGPSIPGTTTGPRSNAASTASSPYDSWPSTQGTRPSKPASPITPLSSISPEASPADGCWWWSKGIFNAQIAEILESLPQGWRHLMAWPLELSRTRQ